MKKIALLLFICQISYAQIDQQQYWGFQDAMARDVASLPTAEGSPFIQNDFEPVKVNKFEGKIFNAKYNAFNGEMQVQTADKLIALDVSDDYKITFMQKGKVYETVTYTNKEGDKTRGFLVKLSGDDNFNLYKKETIIFREKVAARTSYDKEKPAKFMRDKDEYYISVQNEPVSYLPLRKKDLLKEYSSHEKDVKSFIKKNKISMSKEEDLKKLAKYLGTL